MRTLLFLIVVTVPFACTTIDIEKQTAIGLRQYEHDSLSQAISTLSMVIAVNDTCRQCLLVRGFAYKDMKEYGKALEDFDELIRFNETVSIGYANRASVFYLKGDYESALRDFTKAYQIDSSDAYLNPICHMLYINGYKDSACLYYQKLSNLGDTTFDESIKTYCNKKNN